MPWLQQRQVMEKALASLQSRRSTPISWIMGSTRWQQPGQWFASSSRCLFTASRKVSISVNNKSAMQHHMRLISCSPGKSSFLVPISSVVAKRGQSIPSLQRRLRQLTTTTTTVRASSSKVNEDWIISWWVPVVGGLVITTAGGLGYFYQQVGGSFEGLRRTIYFYSYAIPKYVEYRYHLWAKSPQPVWDALDRETSATALQKIFDLEGFYIKVSDIVCV